MRKSLYILMACFSFALCAPAQEGGNATGITLDQLLKNIDKATDPVNKAKDVKTVISKYEGSVSMQEIKLQITATFKAPDKSKTVIKAGENMPDTIEMFNGKEGWTVVPGMGVRQINGPQLDFMKFTAKMSNPANHLRDIFPKIEVAPALEKIEGQDCYKLTCETDAKLKQLPLAIYVDSKTFLPSKMVVMVFTDMGQIPGTTLYSNYKNFDGLVVATVQKTQTMGMEMSTRLISIKYNENISDADFNLPKEFNAPQTEAPVPAKNPVLAQAAAPVPVKDSAKDKLTKKKKAANKFKQDKAKMLEEAAKDNAAADTDNDDDDDKDKDKDDDKD
ncbi:MAG: hypothetical protein WCI51_08365 [Lentisphaerota bacterium]